MLKWNTIIGLSCALLIGACSLSHDVPKNKQSRTEPMPVDEPWILSAPQPTKKASPAKPQTENIMVKTPDTVEARLAHLETEMAKLKLDLAQIDQRYGIKEKPKALAPTPTKTVHKTPSRNTGIRFGLNSGKTRIVFDLPRKVSFTTDLDNTEKFLLIELQDTNLNLKSGNGTGLVSTYTIDTETDGITRVILNLKDNATIVAKEALNPSGRYGNRVFLDLL